MSEDCSVTEQTIYLLYAKAYSKDATKTEGASDTVTKGTVKSHLPDKWKENADGIYAYLKKLGMIELKTKDGKPTKRDGRFVLSGRGYKALLGGLSTNNDLRFTSSKGSKVLNTLLACLQQVAQSKPAETSDEDMTLFEFEDKLKDSYYEERRRQIKEKGVVVIYSRELVKALAENHHISLKMANNYYDRLKAQHKFFTVTETKDEMMEW